MTPAKRWYAVYCQAQKENMAREQLENQGFEAYLPLYKKLRRHARQMRETDAPLFPRYLFVSFDVDRDQWRAVNSTRGVVGLVNFKTDTPQGIADRIITDLRSTQDDGGLVSLAALELFKPGEPVRILEGAFAGHVARYQKMSDHERVEILINFLNQDVRLQLPVFAVEKAA